MSEERDVGSAGVRVRVLVTGGAGFIGSYVVEELVRLGCEVTVLDSLVRQVHGAAADDPDWWPRWKHPEARYVRGDVRDAALLDQVLGEDYPHCVVHLAAEVGVGQAEVEVERYVDANVRGTAVLLEAILRHNASVQDTGRDRCGVQRLVVAGSMSAFGEGAYACPEHRYVRPVRDAGDLADGKWHPRCPYEKCAHELVLMPIPEWAGLQPRGVYAATKRDQEELALLVGRARGLSVAVARLFNVVGPRQSLGNPYTGVAAIFAARARAGMPPRVYEDGGQVRDLVHVTDAAAAIVALVGTWQLLGALRLWADPNRQGSFNVATGEPTTVLDVARAMCEGTAVQPEVTGEFRAGDVRACVGSPDRLVALGWRPQVTAAEALAEVRHLAQAVEPVCHAAGGHDAAHEQVLGAGLVHRLVGSDGDGLEDVAPGWGAVEDRPGGDTAAS